MNPRKGTFVFRYITAMVKFGAACKNHGLKTETCRSGTNWVLKVS